MKIQLRKSLVLASGSKTRRDLLEQAGIDIQVFPVDFDEESLRQTEIARGTPIRDIALKLAEAKAFAAAESFASDHIILAADQILELEGRIFSKPQTMEQAVAHLQSMRGNTHTLQTAMVLYADKKIIWRHISAPKLTMRNISDDFIQGYVKAEGPNVLQSVGVYRIEAMGIHLFSNINGERDAILGLPMLPLLEILRRLDILADDFC
ncbi:Maf family protein [Acetobacteraceae bacterium ESL0709]|nr:Maf family protein [Acetobacteraceae bacterium ESL0697]MDF7677108.1 Maf family protein [Acetobacteraceae bacterium ESL0709]